MTDALGFDGKVAITPVKTGVRRNGEVEITDGLAAGDADLDQPTVGEQAQRLRRAQQAAASGQATSGARSAVRRRP